MIALLIICGIGVMENGNGHKSGKGAGDYKKETVESGVKKVDAAAKGPGPFSTLSPYEEKYIDIRQNGLCYYKTTAVNIWDDPEKMGFEYDDPVYQLIAFKGCNALTTLNIPKNVENIDENAFRGCNHLKTITLYKFSNLYNADGLRKLSWWKEHTQKNGMTIYEKCLLDAGKKGGTITLRGNKVEKILFGAFRKSKAKIIRLENVKEIIRIPKIIII